MNVAIIESFFNKYHKLLLLIPLILVLISLLMVSYNFFTKGTPFNRDISLEGGVSLTLSGSYNIDINDLEGKLKDSLTEDVLVRELKDLTTQQQIGVIIELGSKENLSLAELNQQVRSFLAEYLNVLESELNISSEETDPSLGRTFFRQLMFALLFAFILMALVVFIAFRTFIPSIAVVFAALGDIVITIAILNLVNFKISSAGIAALLLVIGYSIDTDVLLTTKILKRRSEGSFFQRLLSSTKTGLTMTFTTIAAVLVAYFITNSIVLKEMFLMILIALFADIITTYLGNASILKIYCNKKGIT